MGPCSRDSYDTNNTASPEVISQLLNQAIIGATTEDFDLKEAITGVSAGRAAPVTRAVLTPCPFTPGF